MKTFDDLKTLLTATNEEEYEDILRLSTPEEFDSRDEFEECFSGVLGYNPMSYFDNKLIDEEFDEIVEKAPISIQEQLRDKKTEIISRTLDYCRDVNDTVLHKILVEVVKDTVGWKPIEDEDVSLDECILMNIFGEDVDTDDASDDEDDDYDESFAEDEDENEED